MLLVNECFSNGELPSYIRWVVNQANMLLYKKQNEPQIAKETLIKTMFSEKLLKTIVE